MLSAIYPNKRSPLMSAESNNSSKSIKLLYDGKCPLCQREVCFLSEKDADKGLVEFIDITDDNYSSTANGGVEFADGMARIHAILPDGRVIQNVEVFRQIYQALGMGWIYSWTKLPIIKFMVDTIYAIWANLRLKVTGRPDLKTIVAERQQRLAVQKEKYR
jgi:predicted DCC family thiol-disulfide oxidoreductase YuxK